MFLPGAVLPVESAYEALLAELAADVDARTKNLEMYSTEMVPPPGYDFEWEVEGIRRVADEAGFATFHLVGYSAGGAASLLFASRHPDRLRSLPPPWRPSRIAGVGWFTSARDIADPDFAVLRRFDRPVYFALGGRSNPDLYQRIGARLSNVFPDFTLEVFEDRHHFDPPHRIEPARLAAALRAIWARTGS